MRVILNHIKGTSQYDPSIHPSLQNSACGPTTIHVILQHYQIDLAINDLYQLVGTTKMGLFKWRLINRLRRLFGTHFTIQSCSLAEALLELERGNPVALKFDKYFRWQWLSQKKPLYAYHWVPLIGYELINDELYLIIHDNGKPGMKSTLRQFSYADNKHVLDFVKIAKK